MTRVGGRTAVWGGLKIGSKSSIISGHQVLLVKSSLVVAKNRIVSSNECLGSYTGLHLYGENLINFV